MRHADDFGAWLDIVRKDNRAIVRAVSAASKAACRSPEAVEEDAVYVEREVA